MKLTDYPRYNVAYLQLHEETEQVETIRVGDELHVDIAPDPRPNESGGRSRWRSEGCTGKEASEEAGPSPPLE